MDRHSKIGFTIYTADGGWWRVTAYEPSPGAPFVVHRSLGHDRTWYVTHRNTTAIVDWAMSLKTGLEKAALCTEQCDLAPKVKLRKNQDGEPIANALTGPHRKLRDQLRKALPHLDSQAAA